MTNRIYRITPVIALAGCKIAINNNIFRSIFSHKRQRIIDKFLPNIKFVGFIPRNEISSFLGDAYLLLNTSFYEGFSNTFLESLPGV